MPGFGAEMRQTLALCGASIFIGGGKGDTGRTAWLWQVGDSNAADVETYSLQGVALCVLYPYQPKQACLPLKL